MTEMSRQTDVNTLEFVREFNAPIDRVWEYLVESDKRAQWICKGEVEPRVGGVIVFDFDHRRLSNRKPPEIHEGNETAFFEGEVLVYDRPKRIAFTWPSAEGSSATRVDIRLTALDRENTKLVLTHSLLDSDVYQKGANAGWITHLDILDDIMRGLPPRDFWDHYEFIESAS